MGGHKNNIILTHALYVGLKRKKVLIMRKLLPILSSVLFLPTVAFADYQCNGYPLPSVTDPVIAGWDVDKLPAIEAMYKDINSAALMVVKNGKVILNYGNTNKDYNVHSIRKSFLTALIGIAVGRDQIDLDKSMKDFDIDDKSPLSDTEKTATYRQLIKARSGIYHPAAYETDAMAAARPKRHSHNPGEFWYYNNWDFNVAGRLYEMNTGKNIHIAFGEEIAKPLCMQDYDVSLMSYHYEDQTLYPAYPFRMSARDMALFGQLHLQDGLWLGQQVLPKGWVEESTTAYTAGDRNGTSSGYGYMWWNVRTDKEPEFGVTLPKGAYSAFGYGGHRITVLPEMEMVVVNRMNTDLKDGPKLSGMQYDRLLRLIISAIN